ncbi:hypothetical protein J5I95_02125 [Candidatus Poribacteria bacterium]|nr:hypothetical protein [Candidatus Poribacteria bacterium]
MKKRTLVCFLIFTLCVFYTAIPNTVFGQEEGVALANQVFDEYSETLQRDDVKSLLPKILDGLAGAGDDQDIPALVDTAIALINAGQGAALQGLAAGQGVTLTDDHIKLLADPEVQTLLTAETTKELLGLKGAELQAGLAELLRLANEPVEEVTPPPEEEVTPPPEEVIPPTIALANQVFDEHSQTLQRDDVKSLLPQILDGLQQAGDDVDIPGLIDTAIALINAGQGATLQGLAAGQGVPLTDDHITLLADPDVQMLLTAETTKELLGLKGAELQVGLAELLRLANEPVEEVTPPPEEEVTPPPEEEVTPPPEVVPPPPEDKAPPFEPATPTRDYLLGKSRLGGLSLNGASGRRFVEDFIAALAPAGISLEAEVVVDAVLDAVPTGFLPKKQIRNLLLSKRLSVFPQEEDQLDAENFGNAIMPNFTDFLYSDFGDAPNQKYLTSDGLHVYTRVPAKVAGVEFSLSDGRTIPGTEFKMAELGADTIDYTFRLEETLAATNLPAWPDLDAQLFSGVTLRYSNTGSMNDDYIGVTMQPVPGENGVVWEAKLGIPAGRSTYYYFEVMLAEPLTFTALDRDAIAALDPTTATLADVLNPANLHQITIEGWAMPDPRNLQLADRGIVEALFTPNLVDAFREILDSPQTLQFIAGQADLNNIATPKQLRRIQTILLRNTNALTTQFEEAFDPMLASVFTVPRVDLETQSLWTAHIDNIADGNYQLKADVLADDGTVLDRMQENITVDTSAPEANIGISPGEDANATGYMNDDGIYVATAPTVGTAATLKIMGMPTVPGEIAPGRGYLLYQLIALNEDGTPYLGDPSIQKPNTWMPLTVDSTMLVSNIWDAVRGAIAEGRLNAPTDPTLQTVLALPLDGILGILNAGLIQQFADPVLKDLEPFIGFSSLNDSQAQLIVEALGATIDIIDHLVPVTFDPSGHVVMPIQGAQMPLITGDYGIRAMGLDSLFNVGAYAAPTHLRIVEPSANTDRASIVNANIGDFNNDGMVDPEYETGIIYANTKNVMITGTVTQKHPIQSVVIQYKDASDNWVNIDEAAVMGADFEYTWNVDNFDALISAGDTVMVRAKATNALQLPDLEPMPFSIKLDPGIYPPKVLDIVADEGESQNADSGAPQGMVTITASTEPLTGPKTVAVRFEAKRPTDETWIPLGTDNAVASAVGAAVDAALEGATAAPISVDGKQTWSIEVNTAEDLEDTITKDSPGARDKSKDDNQYTIRAFAVDASGKEWPSDKTTMLSVDNVDDVAPLAPTSISVTDVDGVDVVFEDEDGNYTVGGLVDKYDDDVPSPEATFTIKPEAERKTYTSVKFTMTDAAGTDSELKVAETAEGGVFTVKVDVGTLADGTYTFQALAYDEVPNVEADTDDSKVLVTVKNTFRPEPKVLALAVDPESITQTNPDSGAPQGTITLHAYSHEISSPATKGVRLVVKRPGDEEWIDAGEATESTPTTEISDTTLTDFVGDLANAATDTAVVPINRTYQMWAIEVDTTQLEDTITAENPAAARDASKDKNQYTVRAIPIEEAEDFDDPEASPNATAMFSVDNDDDVEPLGPTNIVAVADVAGPIEANEDNIYTVGGIVDDTVPSPIATFTIEPTADPATYASVNLVQTAGEVSETVAEGEAGVLDITIDVGALENGTYMFHALAVDKSGNVQTDESPMITVHVLNFRVSDVADLAVSAVDGTDVAESPAEPIPLRNSVTVSFTVANGSLAAEELSGTVNGDGVPSESAEDPENTFSLMVEVGALADGVYTPDALVTKRNGSVAFPITTVNVDNTGPMVTIESPTDGEAVDSLPTVHASYHDGAGAGVDGTTGSLDLARLQPPDAVEVVVDQAELEKDAEALVYTRSEQLAGGAYRVTVEVADILGNVGTSMREFTVNGTLPTVAIHSPVSGQTFEHGKPPISGEFSGAGTIEITTFTINDVDATPEVDGNQFSYTPGEALSDGDYKVVVAVTDGDGNVAQASSIFTVDMPRDTTPPVISAAAPNGVIRDADHAKVGSAKISAVVTDEQSSILSVKYSINGGQLRSISNLNVAGGKIEAPIDFEAHGAGLYNVRLVATSQGGTTEYTWSFTLIVDNIAPTITSISPSGTIRGGLPVISASANDDSGVSKITITVMDSTGKEVKGKTQDDGESDVEGITRLDFNPEAPLDEGVYTIEVRATDPYENSASAKGTFTIDFDTAAPVITMASPQQDARIVLKAGDKAPTVSIAYADAESGVNVESIVLTLEGPVFKSTPSGDKPNLKPEQKTASQVMYTLPFNTVVDKPERWVGEYVVRLEVADNAHLEGNVSEKSKGARKANATVHQFSFTIESAEGPILAARPINYPNPFKDNTRISFTLARESTVSIVIYDSTLRPVRVLMDNAVLPAGNYTRKEVGSDAFGWDGKSSSGEDMARGIYFCEIIVADGLEPEYAILKLALTR